MVNNRDYILLDGARLEANLYAAKELNKKHISLYKGSVDEDLADVGPYLFTFDKQSEFGNWCVSNGWGEAWGVILVTSADIEICVRYFKSILMVKTEEGQELYFRFYDPRVLKIFLPTCDKKQIIEFFGPIESFIVEGDTKEEAIRLWQQNGILNQEVLPFGVVFGNLTIN